MPRLHQGDRGSSDVRYRAAGSSEASWNDGLASLHRLCPPLTPRNRIAEQFLVHRMPSLVHATLKEDAQMQKMARGGRRRFGRINGSSTRWFCMHVLRTRISLPSDYPPCKQVRELPTHNDRVT